MLPWHATCLGMNNECRHGLILDHVLGTPCYPSTLSFTTMCTSLFNNALQPRKTTTCIVQGISTHRRETKAYNITMNKLWRKRTCTTEYKLKTKHIQHSQMLIFDDQHALTSLMMVLPMLEPMNFIVKGFNMLETFGMARITLSSHGMRHKPSSTSPW